MNKFKIVPLSKKYAREIIAAGNDDFGNEIIEEVATGYGPCRLSLKPFTPGKEKRLLFGYSPFNISNAFNQPGPVFISPDAEEYNEVYRFPVEIKMDKHHFPLTLIGYSKEQKMNYTKLVGDRDVDEMIERIFERHPEVEYLHARNAEAGCFICKIERAES
jgi:hypothetical protein